MSPAFSRAISMNMTSFSSSSTSRIVWVVNVFINSSGAELEPEAAALAGRRFQPDGAVHPLDGFANDGEPDAGAVVVLRPAEPRKDRPDPLVVARFDTDAIVFDPHAQVALDTLRPDPDARRGAGSDEFHGIRQQVG